MTLMTSQKSINIICKNENIKKAFLFIKIKNKKIIETISPPFF